MDINGNTNNLEQLQINLELLEKAQELHMSGQLQPAEDLYLQLIENDPRQAAAYEGLGLIALQAQKNKQALKLLQKAAELSPEDHTYQANLGAAHYALNQFDKAEQYFRLTTQISPDYYDGQLHLGKVLIQQKKFQEAVHPLEEAVKLRSLDPKAFALLAHTLTQLDRLEEADEFVRAAIKLGPADTECIFHLSSALLGLNRPWQAIYWADQLVQKEPDNAQYHTKLANALLGAGLSDAAALETRMALQLEPKRPALYKLHSQCLLASTQWDEALEVIDKGLQLAPNNEELLTQKAAILERKGYLKEAYALIRPLISGRLTYKVQAVNILSTISRHFNAQKETAALLQECLNSPALTPNIRLGFYFQLADLYDDLGEYDQAFQALGKANSLKPRVYRPKAQKSYFQLLEKIYTRDFLNQAPKSRIKDQKMIFIVGMPRSGTSLTEQILASHPDVFGAGEINQMGEISHNLAKMLNSRLPYPECVQQNLNSDVLDQAAENYIQRIVALAPAKISRVTDKMPQNFLHLGLIALLFPQARIIHCHRHPLDTCLSCYFQNFVAEGLTFAYNLENLGHYYCLYHRLMQHWEKELTLPLFNLRYEELIQDTERMVQELLSFCNLPWNDSCLEFYKTRRDIKTASYDQARKPIYSSSVQRWKNYSHHLKPLKQLLSECLPDNYL